MKYEIGDDLSSGCCKHGIRGELHLFKDITDYLFMGNTRIILVKF
jgi:hypothetical protein